MSKKQQTLFQSWQNGSKANQTNSSKHRSNIDPMVLNSDEDDELLRQALEESLRECQLNGTTATSNKHTEVPSATCEEHLPGFDNGAGNTWIYPTNKPIRKYQRDIVETSLFHNTLVTLPTGLGKTFIAAVVMYNFFRWYPSGKIIFMAPTKPLVAQQIQACYEIMGIPLEATSEMTGAMNPTDRKRQWKEKRVFYLTPQVLTNDISRAACPASEVKCLVLDEAHKALGNYAYVQVVQELCKHGAVFRILALSATPGNDMKAIQQVITNLRISKIELRNEESPDIVPYVHNRNIEKTVVPLGPEITQVRDTFLNILSICARRLMSIGVLFTKDISSLTKYMVIQSRDKFRQNPPDNFPRNRAGMTEGDFAICITLTHALDLLLQHGIRGFYNFLAGKTDSDEVAPNRTRTELLKLQGFSQMMEELKSKFGSDCQVGSAVSHPKLFKLREIVVEHFQRAQKEGQETRVMIFSQYRDSVHEIVALLEEFAPLIKAMSFVGHGHSSGGAKTKGFTQADQIRVIKQFSEGNYNTLVSTCVGEEGLDIGDVDMIICYDVHKSPVRLVQRCGRTGRKRDGRIVMLMTEGKEEHVFNQSMLQKKNLLKNIVGNPKLKEFLLAKEPSLIPRHLRPRCHEMPMQVTTSYPVPAARPSKSLGPTGNNISVVRKSKITKCFYLSDSEADYWKRSLQSNQLVPVVPDSKTADSRWGLMDDKLTLNLDKWLPWQASLQPYHTVGHSTLTKNYVNIVEHIQSQQEDWYDNYRQAGTDVGEVDGHVASPPREPSFDIGHDVFSPGDVQNKSSRDSGLPHSTMSRCGLYSPDFLDLFNSVSIRIDSPDIPNPPPFSFVVSADRSPLATEAPSSRFSRSFSNSTVDQTRQLIQVLSQSSSEQIRPSELSPDRLESKAIETNPPISEITATRLTRKTLFTSTSTAATGTDLNMNETTAPQTPPKSDAESSTFFLEPSPILSQRQRRGPLKRTLERATSTPAPVKRLKMEETASGTSSSRPLEEQGVPCSIQHSLNRVNPLATVDESLLSITQFIDLLDENSQPEHVPSAKPEATVQANFDLEVEFLDSSQSLPASLEVVQQEPVVTPLKKIKLTLLPESPVFDFMEKSLSPSPIRPKAEFTLELPVTPEPKEMTHPKKSPVSFKAEFSLGFPDTWDEDVLAPSPQPEPKLPTKSTKLTLPQTTKPLVQPTSKPLLQPDVQPAFRPPPHVNQTAPLDFQSAWDDGFSLSLSDIEDIEVLEKGNLVQQNGTKNEEPRLVKDETNHKIPSVDLQKTATSVTETSAIRRELEDIFGPDESVARVESPASSIEFVEEKEPAKRDTPPIFTVDSDDDMFAEVTPAKPTVDGRSRKSILMTSDEDSPLLCRKLNRKRNPLMTQSTPIAQRESVATEPAKKVKAGRNRARKAGCSFLEEEADLSLVDGSCSSDEEGDDTQDGDHYERSFVDDIATQAVNDTMRAVYLESVRSPMAQQGFVFRPPAKQMNRSEIFSQAVVEQDSNYELDSFCVDSDEAMEESTWNEPSVILPATRTRKPKPKIIMPAKEVRPHSTGNGRRRKRIIFEESSSDEDEVSAPPAKKPTESLEQNAAGIVAKELVKPFVFQQKTISRPDPVATKFPSRNEGKTKPEGKIDDVPRPVNRVGMVPATDRAVFMPLPSNSSGSSSSTSSGYSTISSRSIASSSSRTDNEAWTVPATDRAVFLSNNNHNNNNNNNSRSSTNMTVNSSVNDISNSATLSPPRTMLISSRQVATTTQVISSLQVKYRCATHVCSFEVADFVVSSQLGVIRKLHSEFTNGSSRSRLQEQVRRLTALYDKPYLIVEADRGTSRDPRFKSEASLMPDASSVIFKPNTPYFLQTLAALAQTELSVLHSESQEHTARLLNDLGRQETLKGLSLPSTEKLNAKQDGILKFLQRIPEINPAVALLMASQFRSLREILCSSAEMLSQRCKITAVKARNIVHAFRVNHAPSK